MRIVRFCYPPIPRPPLTGSAHLTWGRESPEVGVLGIQARYGSVWGLIHGTCAGVPTAEWTTSDRIVGVSGTSTSALLTSLRFVTAAAGPSPLWGVPGVGVPFELGWNTIPLVSGRLPKITPNPDSGSHVLALAPVLAIALTRAVP